MKDINVIMTDINSKLNKVEKTIEKTKEYYKTKLKEVFLNDIDAYYEYIKDEIKEEEVIENEENEEANTGKKKKKRLSFVKKFIKSKKNSEKNKNKKNNEVTEDVVTEQPNENNDDTNTNENPITNDQLVEKEDITDLTNLLTDEEKLKKEIEDYEIDVNKEKFVNEIVKRYNDKFIPIMQSFYSESRTSYEKLKNFLKEANEDFANLCKSFGEDPETTEPSELFTLFNDFWDQFLVR